MSFCSSIGVHCSVVSVRGCFSVSVFSVARWCIAALGHRCIRAFVYPRDGVLYWCLV